MASPSPQSRAEVRNYRESTMEGDLLNDEKRTVIERRTSLYVNVTDYARQTLDIKKGDDVIVETFKDRLVVRKSEE